MSYDFEVQNSQSAVAVPPGWVESIARGTLEAEGVVSAEISIALVDDPRIHEVNRAHLDHDYPTDVISFLYDEAEVGEADDARRGSGKHLEGELVISGDTAAREARSYGWEGRDELALYVVHGLLHLCGYDDLTEDEQIEMRRREASILKNWGLTPHY